MKTYEKTIKVPAVELEVLNGMMSHVTPITIEDMKLIEDACTVSWGWQKATEWHGYLDRLITAEFDNGMIADIWFYIGIGEINGTYGGIQFGDKDTVFTYCGEYTDDCHEEVQDCERTTVDGTYVVINDGDRYVITVEPE